MEKNLSFQSIFMYLEVTQMVIQLFMSHTKLDERFCDRFDRAAARVGVKVFRSEFEEIKPPAWKTIKKAMDASSALFLLVGKQLVKAQEASEEDPKSREEWKHTRNWIAYEIGLACQRGIDVWVCCDDVKINFPVPYLNNYTIYAEQKWMRTILEEYSEEETFPLGKWDRKDRCVFKKCRATYNLHSGIPKNGEVICPTCLRTNVYTEGWLLEE